MFEAADKLMSREHWVNQDHSYYISQTKTLSKESLDEKLAAMFKSMNDLLLHIQGSPDDLQEILSTHYPELYDKWVMESSNKIAHLFFP